MSDRSVPFSLFVLALAATPVAAQAASKLPADRAPGAATVTVEHCSKWLHQLASEEFGGRGTGQEGFQKAAEFVRDHFAGLGLKPAGDDGTFFQKVPWGAGRVVLGKCSLAFGAGSSRIVIPGERLGGVAAESETATGPAVLVTSIAGDAFANADLKGKVVVVQVDPPQQFDALRAMSGKEAAAVVFAQTEPVGRTLQSRSGGRGNRALRGMRMMPSAVAFGGEDSARVLALAASGEGAVRPLGVDAELQLTVEQVDAPAWNVCAVLRGSDPAVADEYVVIGSHLDHLGRRGERFWPGADDDGSGTTGVMAVATMFAKNPTPPRRSVLFLCFCGEENGLRGSRFFAENPTIPLSSIVGELQMDMIGRNEEENVEGNKGEKAEDNVNTLHLVGSRKLSPQLHELCMAKNEAAGFELEWDQEGMFGRSDHANFARMGVPIAFFFTGLHRDYHQTTDTPDKIDYPKLLRVATYVYDIAFELAQQPGRPLVDPELWQAYRGKGTQEPAAPVSK